MKRKIKFMGEYAATCLWSYPYGGMLDLDKMNLSKNLIIKLKKWSKDWDNLFWKEINFDDDKLLNYEKRIKDKRFFNSKNYKKLKNERYILAKLVKRELKCDIYIFEDEKVINNINPFKRII